MDEFKDGKRLTDEQYGRYPEWQKLILAEMAGTIRNHKYGGRHRKVTGGATSDCEADSRKACVELEKMVEEQ